MTHFVEVVDCSASLFLSSPLRNELPLCRVVLGSFTVNLKIPQPGKYLIIQNYNFFLSFDVPFCRLCRTVAHSRLNELNETSK